MTYLTMLRAAALSLVPARPAFTQVAAETVATFERTSTGGGMDGVVAVMTEQIV